MRVDTHTHFYDPSRPEGVPWPPADNGSLYRTVLPEHHRELAQPHGITGTVVVEASAWLDDNQWILDLADDDPWLLGLIGHVDPGPEFVGGIDRFADHPKFLGIRLGGGLFDNVEQGSNVLDSAGQLAQRDLTLDVIVSGYRQIEGVADVAHRFPNLRIVINHVAHVPIDGETPDAGWLGAMAKAVSASNQVYCKVSGLVEASVQQPAPADPEYYRPTLEALMQVFGGDRLIYGSNWPVSDRAAPYETVVAAVEGFFTEQGDEGAEKLWWRNAFGAYRWPE
ncbi:MAG: amidohydrolase family protein [Candidatus Latescibacterota bacterium]|nr:amidohydrolase family protein [Candidatus Latescibacterota bacterium]